jgi:solute carrier family 25 oxoglutarate transporter 11
MYRISKMEGIPAFWRGSMPFVKRAVVVGGTQVATYDQFKSFFAANGMGVGIANQFMSSMTAGLLYATITMPLETTKNRMAFQKPDIITGELPYRTIIQTCSLIARTEGTWALWRGFLPYYGRCGGHTVLMFMCVDQLRASYSEYQ